ncbi:hypothetical protein SB783_42735, partial [Paraburkholderia sp. SIMBA_009]
MIFVGFVIVVSCGTGPCAGPVPERAASAATVPQKTKKAHRMRLFHRVRVCASPRTRMTANLRLRLFRLAQADVQLAQLA